MSEENPKITRLKDDVKTLEQEMGLAIMFHESWKPTAYDDELHQRMGKSYATHTFSIIRTALRREMLLALIRIWDSDYRTIGIPSITNTLSDPAFFDTFCAHRAKRLSSSRISLTPELGLSNGWSDSIKETLSEHWDEVSELVKKYKKGGSHYEVVKSLLTMRNVSLAHRQSPPKEPGRADATDEEIESFYQDNLEIVRLLLSIVLGRAFNLTEAADVYQTYAGYFWAAARGEVTAGHPSYRPIP
ncbi:hypothetical protein [Paraburkholderia xenovorans]|uniref:AbiU2 domain-containing protein n=1 Tax=Paraburkholderia xenovorans TaxID=36873 RepID=UPI0015C56A45|nr:hypothetical protein [Paraburkholderia xenovorans]NPT36323.1 hypothetical protein [Paraburkholderia xenovorans]